MIADSHKISDFVQAVKDKHYEEIVMIAEAEATAAERMMYKHRRHSAPQPAPGTRYALDLKRFIDYMRYGVKPSGIPPEEFLLFDNLRTRSKMRSHPMG